MRAESGESLALRWTQLLRTAQNDLQIRADNAAVRQQRINYARAGADPRAAGALRQSGFLKRHVQHAVTPSDVLRAALRDAADVARNHDIPVTTRALYENFEELRQAYEEARATERREAAESLWANEPALRRRLTENIRPADLLIMAVDFLFRVSAIKSEERPRINLILMNNKLQDMHRISLLYQDYLPAALRVRINRLSLTVGAAHEPASA